MIEKGKSDREREREMETKKREIQGTYSGSLNIVTV